MTSGVELEGRDLHHAYRGAAVLRGVELNLRAGEVVSLLGANGAGKSTLLRLLLGLMRPRSGTVHLNGSALADLGRRAIARELAYVPQLHQMAFPYVVREVVLLGRLPHGRIVGAPGAADRAVVDAVLDRLAIAHLARRAFTELSGGERQLVLIARALAQGARLLLLDEPAAGLDYGNQLRLLALLRRLAAEGCGVLLTTHQPEHVLLGSDRVLVLGAGTVVAEGPPRRVVTRELMRRLYGVDAEPIELPDGRVAIVASMPQ